MVLHDGIGGCKPQTAPFPLRCEIRVEYLGKGPGRYTHTLILYGYFEVFPLLQGESISFAYRSVLKPHVNHTALRHGLLRVYDEVADYLADLPHINIYRISVARNRDFTSDVRASRSKLAGITDQFRYGNGPLNGRPSPGKGKQLL